jgi:hypothetical protein
MEEHLARAVAATTGIAKENAGRRVNPGTVGGHWRFLVGEDTRSAPVSNYESGSV